MKHIKLKKLSLSAMFLALGIVLPFLTAQIKEFGDSLLPMHIPVMLCGLICGPIYGFRVGLILPVTRAIIFSMPPLYPNSLWMAAELATYGLTIGLLYRCFKVYKIRYVYISLVVAMLSGRIVWGIAKTILMGLSGKAFTVEAFVVGGFVDAIPGIILQFILIPYIMAILKKSRLLINKI